MPAFGRVLNLVVPAPGELERLPVDGRGEGYASPLVPLLPGLNLTDPGLGIVCLRERAMPKDYRSLQHNRESCPECQKCDELGQLSLARVRPARQVAIYEHGLSTIRRIVVHGLTDTRAPREHLRPCDSVERLHLASSSPSPAVSLHGPHNDLLAANH